MNLVLIKVGARSTHAVDVQEVLTKYGCNITVRLGLHEITEESCANDGLIILQVKPDEAAIDEMVEALKKINAVSVKTVNF